MSYTFEIARVEPVTLAVAEALVARTEIPARIIGLFDIVYGWLPASGLKQVGHNFALYDQFSPHGMRMRVGFPVSARFADGPHVQCCELPGGTAAHTRHVGPYHRLGEAHTQLNDWCSANSLRQAGLAWEVYGDPSDDPAKLVTDVYVLVEVTCGGRGVG